MGFARANLIQALLFLLMHVLGWVLLGQFHSGFSNSRISVHPSGETSLGKRSFRKLLVHKYPSSGMASVKRFCALAVTGRLWKRNRRPAGKGCRGQILLDSGRPNGNRSGSKTAISREDGLPENGRVGSLHKD